jgi:hypothetical protein
MVLPQARAFESGEAEVDAQGMSRRDQEARKFYRHSYVRLIIAQHVSPSPDLRAVRGVVEEAIFFMFV